MTRHPSNSPSRHDLGSQARRSQAFALAALLFFSPALLPSAGAQTVSTSLNPDLDPDLGLSPTRPTIANSATVQKQGVLQVESGYDAYPQSTPGNQQTVDTSFFYTPFSRFRLDFTWSAFNHQQSSGEVVNGVGTITLGGKVVLREEDYHRRAPGVAFQYEAELPTAFQTSLQGYGQQLILLVNHHYGAHGDLDVIANGSIVQSDCQTAAGCSYGGQQSFALSYHLQKETRLYAEAFGQNVSQSNTPPGTYIFGGFYHQFGTSFGIDGGLRFGVSDHSASIGTTVGLVLGKRLRDEAAGPIRLAEPLRPAR